MELNKVLLVGNLTRDPESRHLQSGAQVCKMGLAVNRRYGTTGGERKEETLFIDVEAWNKTAELCSQYLRKGAQVLIEGRLKMDQFQTQAGENRTKILVVADRVSFGAKPTGEAGGQRDGGSRAPRQSSQPSNVAEDFGGYPDGQTEDDLPF